MRIDTSTIKSTTIPAVIVELAQILKDWQLSYDDIEAIATDIVMADPSEIDTLTAP